MKVDLPPMKRCVAWAIMLGSLLLPACGDLLPRSDAEVRVTWTTFDEAKAALDRVEPHRTTAGELRAAGFDPYTNPNVELLNYSDILRRFPMSANVSRVDPGLQQCMEAGKACFGYSVELRSTHRERVGPFVLDLLGFRRETLITGWSFNALILIVDDRVTYALYGGKPSISEREKSVEPLGPLQNWNGSSLIK